MSGETLAILGLFSACVEAYRLADSAAGHDTDTRRLRTQFSLEKERLLNWGRLWGLVCFDRDDGNGSRERRMLYDREIRTMSPTAQSTVQEVLRDLGALLQEAEKLGTKYGMVAAGTGDWSSFEFLSQEHSAYASAAAAKGGTRRPFRHFKWAITDKEKYSGLIEHLRRANNSLESLLSPARQESLQRALSATVLAMTEADDGVDTASDLNQLSEASEGYPLLQETTLWAIKVKEMPPDDSLHSISAMSRSFHNLETKPSKQSTRYLTTYFEKNDSGEVTAKVDIIVEWQPWLPSEDKLSRRMPGLIRLLQLHKPSALRLLKCYGYVLHKENGNIRLALLYHVPSLDPFSTSLHGGVKSVKSLQSLLKKPDNVNPPSLNSRFELAKILSYSMLQYHASGWVHHDFRAKNLVFAQHPSSVSSTSAKADHVFLGCDLGAPFVAGLSFARPDSWASLSTSSDDVKGMPAFWEEVKWYWSPNYLKSVKEGKYREFERCHDVYSLGCVLLEIGLWLPLDKLKWRDEYSNDQHNWHRRLLKESKNLFPACGQRYRDVVIRCLNWQQTSVSNDVQRLCWDIVRSLEDLVV